MTTERTIQSRAAIKTVHTYLIANDNSDAYTTPPSTFSNSATSHPLDNTSAIYHNWLRWNNVVVPSGIKHGSVGILSAKISFWSPSTYTGNSDLRFHGIKEDNTGNFTGYSNAEDRTLTGKSVDWVAGSWSAFQTYWTDSVAPIIDEIVKQSGWASGNAIGVRIENYDTDIVRNFRSHNQDPNDAPHLELILGPQYTYEKTVDAKAYIIRQEVVVEGTLLDATDEYNPAPSVVFTDEDTGYAFFVDNTGKVVYSKTTNGGKTWGTPVDVTAQTDCWNVAVWYDPWTKGTTGTKIHIVFLEIGTDTAFYNYLDTNGDSLGSEIDVTGDMGASTPTTHPGSNICKATNGKLYIFATASAAGDIYESDDNGATWGAMSSTVAWAVDDRAQILPLSGGDLLFILQDVSDNKITSSVYDSSEGTWSAWEDVMTSIIENSSVEISFSAMAHPATGDVYLTANTRTITNGLGNILVSKFSDSGRTWSSKANAYDSVSGDYVGSPFMMIDYRNDRIYVLFSAVNGASDTLAIHMNRSSDGGDTWDHPELVVISSISNLDDYKYVRGTGASNHRLYAVWYDDDNNVIYGNTVAIVGGPEYTIEAKANIVRLNTKTVTAKARIQHTREKTVSANARINFVRTKTVSALADIFKTSVKTISAVGRILTVGLAYTVTALARIQHTREKIISTKARIQTTETKNISAKASIKHFDVTKTISANARVQHTREKTIQAAARVLTLGNVRAISAKANIVLYESPKTVQSELIIDTSPDVISTVILTAVDTQPANTSITYYISVDNGSNWDEVTSGVAHTPTMSGSQLKWKAVLETTDLNVTPEIDTVSLDWYTAKEQTIEAKARIQKTREKTVQALARINRIEINTIQAAANIRATLTKTITAVGRIRVLGNGRFIQAKAAILRTFEKSIEALARINKINTKTVESLARIETTETKTVEAAGNVRATLTKTIEAKARILTVGVAKSITAKAAILRTFEKNVNAKARIETTETKTVQATARIETTETKTVTALGRIQHTREKTIEAKARIHTGGVPAGPGIQAKANIRATLTKTVAALARIQVAGITKTISSLARIVNTYQSTVEALANIRATISQSIEAQGNIRSTAGKTIQAKARVVNTYEYNVTAKARIQTLETKTIEAVGRIEQTREKIISAKARIVNTYQKTVEAKANLRAAQTKTIQAKARILTIGNSKTIEAKAAILRTFEKSVTALARIEQTRTKTISAKARIYRTYTKNVTAVGRIEQTETKSVQAKARIQIAGISGGISAKANIRATVSQTVRAKASIFQPKTKSIQAKASIKLLGVTQTVSANAVIVNTYRKTIQAKASIEKLDNTKTISAKASIYKERTKTVTAKAKIKAYFRRMEPADILSQGDSASDRFSHQNDESADRLSADETGASERLNNSLDAGDRHSAESVGFVEIFTD